jgi:hypothetical protein
VTSTQLTNKVCLWLKRFLRTPLRTSKVLAHKALKVSKVLLVMMELMELMELMLLPQFQTLVPWELIAGAGP